MRAGALEAAGMTEAEALKVAAAQIELENRKNKLPDLNLKVYDDEKADTKDEASETVKTADAQALKLSDEASDAAFGKKGTIKRKWL